MSQPELRTKKRDRHCREKRWWYIVRWSGFIGMLLFVHLELMHDQSELSTTTEWATREVDVPPRVTNQKGNNPSTKTSQLPATLEEHKASLEYMGNRKTNTGWNVDTLCLQKKHANQEFIVYGVGAGEDISWDIGMLERYGATVVIIDPTEKAKRHVESVLTTKSYGSNTIRFLPEGLSDQMGEITFALPANPDHVSMRSVDLADPNMLQRTVSAPVRRLQDFMDELQHQYLDILKIDIEGAEYDVLEALLKEDYLPFTQLLVEYHDRFLRDRSRHDRVLIRLAEAGFVELWSQNGGQERGYVKRNDLSYCADGESNRYPGSRKVGSVLAN